MSSHFLLRKMSRTSGYPDRIFVRRRIAIIFVLCLQLLGATCRADSPEAELYQLYAIFVFKLSHFVHWPDNLPNGDDRSHWKILVYGNPELSNTLREIYKGKTVDNKEINVSSTSSIDELATVHLLFISKDARYEWLHVRDKLVSPFGDGIITISDYAEFTEQGGMISLFFKDGKLKFKVNKQICDKAQLKIEAQFLAIAEEVIK